MNHIRAHIRLMNNQEAAKYLAENIPLPLFIRHVHISSQHLAKRDDHHNQ